MSVFASKKFTLNGAISSCNVNGLFTSKLTSVSTLFTTDISPNNAHPAG